MKTNLKKTVLAGAVALAGATTFAGWNLSLSEGWRLTGGAEFGGPVNANVRSRGTHSAGAGAATVGGLTRAQAQAIVQGQLDAIKGGSRADFGGGAFIDPNSAISATLPDYTRNWRLPLSSKASGVANSVSYGERSVKESATGFAASEDDTSVGASVELSKTLWESDDLPIGVDFAFAFAWLRRNNLVNSEGVTYAREERTSSGSADLTLGDQAWRSEPWIESEGGMIGPGSATGPGPVMDLSLLGMNTRGGGESVSRYVERVAVRGDWEEWDFRLAFKPWWDVADWLRVYGTFGVEIAKTYFDMDVTSTYGSVRRHRSRGIDGWQVNGIAGLGAALRWQHMTLGVDVLARFLQQDITIDDNEVSGKIDRQRWLARVYLGVDF